jgi:hypothetical protein
MKYLTDDAEVKALLVLAGMSDTIEPRAGAVPPCHLNAVFAHNSQVIAVKRYWGYTRDVDNGYIALVMERREVQEMGEQGMAEKIEDFLSCDRIGPDFYATFEDRQPQHN